MMYHRVALCVDGKEEISTLECPTAGAVGEGWEKSGGAHLLIENAALGRRDRFCTQFSTWNFASCSFVSYFSLCLFLLCLCPPASPLMPSPHSEYF